MKWWHDSWHSHGTGNSRWGFTFTLIRIGLCVDIGLDIGQICIGIGPFWFFLNTKHQ